MLAETERDPWTATFQITFPAKSHEEARYIVEGIPTAMKPMPVEILSIEKERPAE